MKKFYLFVILLICGLGYAQTKYFVKISNLNYSINAGVKNNTDSRIIITARFKDGSTKQMYYRSIRNNGDKEVNFDVPIIDYPSKPVSIECFAFVNFRTGTDANRTRSINIDSYCANGSFDGDYSPRMSHIKFNYRIDPVLDVFQGSPDFLPTDENITINSSTGYDSSYYKWQYTFNPSYNNTTDWKDFTKYSTASISTNANEVISGDAGLKHGQKIYFRLKPCGTTTYGVGIYSVRLSAPKILSSAPEKVSCYDLGSADGKLKLQFNRPLYPGETFSMVISGASTKTFPNITKLEADNSYTLSGLGRGNYQLTMTGFYNGSNTYSKYTELGGTPYPFTIGAPSPLDYTVKGNDILCYGVNNGSITITPSGGTRDSAGNDYYSIKTDPNDQSPDVWVSFPNNSTGTITGLAAGTYYIKVKDMKGCVARKQVMVNGVIELGDEKVIEQKITEPSKALEVVYTFKKDPTFYGAKNGILVAAVTGGTIKDDNSYNFTWKNSNGDTVPATGAYNSADKTYNITLENAPDDKYKLTVTDKNYLLAANKAGCSVIESLDSLTQPKRIVVKLAITQPISCNSKSLNPSVIENKAGDGILTATVEGGVPFNTADNGGLLYKFFWSKYNEDTQKWDDLATYKTATASNLSEGLYAVNVKDANAIVQGTYDTVQLITASPTTQEILEPKQIELLFDSVNVSCYEGSNGWALVNVTGGTLAEKDGVKDDYKYVWYYKGKELAKTQKITNLTKGTYTVEVIDSNQCFATKDIEITEPDFAVTIDYPTISTPTFSGASDGKIVAKITGGTVLKPVPSDGRLYNYEWRNLAGVLQNVTTESVNGEFFITLDNVPADSYFLTIKDQNYDEATGQTVNCSVVESKRVLTEPDPLKVVFKIVQSISCNAKNEFGDKTDTTPKDNQRDESQDGILMAQVTGGTTLSLEKNNGLPYYYSWKKQEDNGTWKDLAVQDSIISNLSHGNYALNVRDRNNVILGTYTNGNWIAKDSIQFMEQPPILSVKIAKGDVFCNGGNDGWATATAEGGSGKYTYEWSNEVKSDKNTVLKTGNYWVIATDEKGCTAYAEVFIDQPKAPLSIKYTEVVNPSFYKATNGKIVVEVTGGTIAADNTYWFEWKNSKGITQTNTSTSFSNNTYTIALTGLPEEIYTLTVRDANYNVATNKTSCTVANSVTELDDPDPLEVTFEVIRTISCNVSNEFGNEIDANPLDNQRDESQDGILKAHVTGGIQLAKEKNNELPYYYTWKKKQANGSWTIWKNTGDTAEYLSEGTYALNIEDANGIKLGTYVNNVLVKEIDAEKYIPQPDQLKLTFTKFDVGCTTGDDGWAEAHVTGGTPPYTYEWTNGETTSKIENITTNNYFVIATDAKGCVVQGSIFVGDPNGILSTETVKNPICYKGIDGSIELNVTGGNLPYTYLWNTGAVTKDLNNLTAGNYEVTITCPECCVYKKRFVLKDPEAVIVNVGPDRTLCIDQSLDLDASIKDPQAKYSWTSTNGFTSNEAKINVSKAGTYHVKATTALGCIGEDEIVIKTSQMAISAEFLLSSQAYLDEEVILVNTSSPFGESTDWVIPNGVKVVEQKEKYVTLKFDAVGVYSIGLKQTQGECYAVFTKNIMVEKRGTLPNTETASQFIIDFIVTPNPNNGNFKAIVNLENNSAINLRLFSSSGQNTMIQKQDSGKKKYEVDFNTSLQSGVYIVVLETGQQTLVKKIIIN